MGADYYTAETEAGHHIDDPSEDALFDLMAELDHRDNTFLTIEPAVEGLAWYACVAVLDEGGYELERRDPHRDEHEVTADADRGRVARELTIWLAGRDHGRGPSPTASRFWDGR